MKKKKVRGQRRLAVPVPTTQTFSFFWVKKKREKSERDVIQLLCPCHGLLGVQHKWHVEASFAAGLC
jgi:hypothetical protein